MSIVLGLFGTVLPNMRAQDSAGGSVDDMGAGVESSQSVAAFDIDAAVNWSIQRQIERLIKIMQETFANFLYVDDLIRFVTSSNGS